MPKFVVIGSVPKTFWVETATPTKAREAVVDYLMRGLIEQDSRIEEDADAQVAPFIYNVWSFDGYYAGEPPAW